MKYRVQNTKVLTPDELLSILCKSAKLYSEYANTALLFIFREKSQKYMIFTKFDLVRIILCTWLV